MASRSLQLVRENVTILESAICFRTYILKHISRGWTRRTTQIRMAMR